MSSATTTAARVGGFLAGLAVLFTLALGAGTLWGPSTAAPPTHDGDAGHAAEGHDEPGTAERLPGGLARSQDGYTLALDRTSATAGDDVPVGFTITGPDGEPVTEYDVEHAKQLHLVVVRRDLAGFQHVHPTLDAGTGRWTTAVTLTPGSWRVYADFTATDGPSLILGTDLSVAGDVPVSAPVAEDVRTDEVDGYTAELTGDLVAGNDSEVSVAVSRDGRPVTDLEPYLGALGHLVALREGDLAYLHVHPHDSESAGPDIDFTAEVPSEGRYRLFLDFQHAGTVRTATFDLTAVRP